MLGRNGGQFCKDTLMPHASGAAFLPAQPEMHHQLSINFCKQIVTK